MMAISPVISLSGLTLTPTTSPTASTKANGFGAYFSHALDHLSQAQTAAETDVAQAISGQGSITQAMTAVSESQTALDVATSMRNALVQAGTSIMNLQI